MCLGVADRSEWDDGRWEWEDTPRTSHDTPRRDNRSNSRHYQPSPSPMFIGASPDARLVSPWHGGNTPQSGKLKSFSSQLVCKL